MSSSLLGTGDGRGSSSSDLKASTFLLLAYLFQNELTQFTKAPVNRLRTVLEEHSDVTVMWPVVNTIESRKSSGKEKEVSFENQLYLGARSDGNWKKRMKNKQKEKEEKKT